MSIFAHTKQFNSRNQQTQPQSFQTPHPKNEMPSAWMSSDSNYPILRRDSAILTNKVFGEVSSGGGRLGNQGTQSAVPRQPLLFDDLISVQVTKRFCSIRSFNYFTFLHRTLVNSRIFPYSHWPPACLQNLVLTFSHMLYKGTVDLPPTTVKFHINPKFRSINNDKAILPFPYTHT